MNAELAWAYTDPDLSDPQATEDISKTLTQVKTVLNGDGGVLPASVLRQYSLV